MALALGSVLLPGLSACAKFSQDPEIDPPAGSSGSGEGSGTAGCALYCSEYGSQYEVGTASSRGAVDEHLLLGDKASLVYGSHASLTAAHEALNNGQLPIASRDTGATDQWDEGWTGKGVKVAVLDEFNWDDGIVNAHGEKVSLVVNSVAPEATLEMRHTTLYNSDIRAGWSYFNENEFYIINNSFGRARYNHNTNEEDTSFDADVAAAVSSNYEITGSATYSNKILFIFSANNSGHLCPDRRIQECNFSAAVVKRQRDNGKDDKDAFIWVGSLDDAGTAMAYYSSTAGDLKNDFIVAHDDILSAGDGAGTSFAAPRVTGAAALVRQKFPLLNGQELKSLLLETATDIGTPGPDPVYGMGKLDLSNALSPQGMFSAE